MNMQGTAHSEMFILALQITLLLASARMLGEIARRLGQPSVIGEILAGILLGPSCLGAIFPFVHYIFSPENPAPKYFLQVLSLMGVMLLLLLTGFETDLKLIARKAKSVMGTSAGGLTVSLVSGFTLGMLIPDHFLNQPSQRLIFALFLATSMSISAIPVIAKILIDLNLIRRDIGQAIIATGMIDDTVGWMILSIVSGLAAGQSVNSLSIAKSVGSVLLFIVLSFTVGRWLVRQALIFVQDEIQSPQRYITLVVLMAFAWGTLGHLLNLEPLFGAFMIGIVFTQMPRLPQFVHERIESMTMGIFAPMFFAIAGLKVNLGNLLKPEVLTMAVIVIGIATASKILGTYLGARLIGRVNHWTALSFGAALNARGAMEIIVATIGLSLGILTTDFYSIIVLMAVITTLFAPIALRYTLRHVPMSDEEIARIKEEDANRTSPIARIHRILVPLRNREESDRSRIMLSIKSLILQEIDKKNGSSVTLFSVVPPDSRAKNPAGSTPSKLLFPQKEVVPKLVPGSDPVNTILDECQKDYDLLLLGASEQSNNSETLFSSVIDSLIRLAPCPTAIVHAKDASQFWSPKKILIPTSGSLASKYAVEFGYLLSSRETETVTILNVVVKEKHDWHALMHDDIFERQLKNSIRMLEDLRKDGEAKGIPAKAEVKVGTEPEQVILEVSQKENYDLIILGTDVHPVSDRLFLGPRVERILRNATCPVLIVNTI